MSAAFNKHTVPGLGVSLKDTCFRYCFCNQSAVIGAITEAMYYARFRSLNAIRVSASRHRANHRTIQRPGAALHSVRIAAYTDPV